MSDSVISGNGFGIANDAGIANIGQTTLSNCTVSDNPNGGIEASGTLTVSGSTIADNAGFYGITAL